MLHRIYIKLLLLLCYLPLYTQHEIEIHQNNRVASLLLSDSEYQDYINGDYKKRTIAKELYKTFDDNFDFIVLILNEENKPEGKSFGTNELVSNDVLNIGMNIRDNTSLYGSRGKLKGVINLNRIDYIENGPFLHEIMHAWGNSILPTELVRGTGDDVTSTPNGLHWGFTGGNVKGQLGGFQQSTLIEKGNDKYLALSFGQVANNGNSNPYSEFELYLMGYIPVEKVKPFDYFTGITHFTPSRVINDYSIFVASNRTTVDADYIKGNFGQRVPNSTNSQKTFNALVVVITKEKLTEEQWDIVDKQCERFSRTSSDGKRTYNFWEATNGLGTFEIKNIDQSTLSTYSFDMPKNYRLYPNPITDYLHITSPTIIKTAEVYTIQGQKIASYSNRNTFNLKHLSNGVYFLKIIDNSNRIQNIKFFKK